MRKLETNGELRKSSINQHHKGVFLAGDCPFGNEPDRGMKGLSGVVHCSARGELALGEKARQLGL